MLAGVLSAGILGGTPMLDDVAKIRTFVTVVYIVAVVLSVILGLNDVPQALTTD